MAQSVTFGLTNLDSRALSTEGKGAEPLEETFIAIAECIYAHSALAEDISKGGKGASLRAWKTYQSTVYQPVESTSCFSWSFPSSSAFFFATIFCCSKSYLSFASFVHVSFR